MKGLDANVNLTDYAGALVEAGFSYVCRYLPMSTKADPLSCPEAQHLSDMGLSIVSIYESGEPIRDSYFTFNRGVTDGHNALTACQQVGQPAGRPVFFTVDEDADPGAVLDYFKGIRSTSFLATYLVGSYGSSAVNQALKEAGLAHFTWVAQPPDWQGGFGFQGKDIQQGPQKTLTFGGLSIDADTDTTNEADFGQWSLPPSRLA